ncbi:MAG: 16S rRNA pseudouridine(516) synthase [Clostridiales bacterium]|nr:16S rRNA pseudouridine(516) synthase [Clostridiales bacterium]
MGAERVDKLLANTGRFSRKEVRELIHRRQVSVNGALVLRPETKVESEGAVLQVAGEEIPCGGYTYLMLNKPAGVLTATEDRRQATVMDLLPPELRRQKLAPVGRLDKDTEGLLLLTNDGVMTHRLLSPNYHVDKVYLAETEGTVDDSDVAAFAAGLTLGDGTRCQPAGLEAVGENLCLVTLREGKFHQVKRMLAQRGKPVRRLTRLSMGPLTLDKTLAPGAFRPLDSPEVAALARCCGLAES